MFRNTESRSLFLAAMILGSLLLLVLGNWLLSGILGSITVGAAVLLNAGAVLYTPFVPRHFYGNTFACLLVLVTIVATLFGCVAFGWWGLAYVAAAITGYLLASATQS